MVVDVIISEKEMNLIENLQLYI